MLRMDSTLVIKSVIQASNQYKNNASDHNLLHLQKQLDMLISMTSRGKSLKFFAPHQMIPTECLTCLMAILNEVNSPTELSSKTIVLLFNLAADSDIREALQSTFNVTALLAAFLKQYTGDPSNRVVLQCAQLLQRVTYQYKILFPNNYIEDLIKFLVTNIQGQETELTLPCLGLMANLCRNTVTIQTHLKAMDNLKIMYKILMRYLSHASLTVVAFSLSILASLILHEEFGEKIFSGRNIKHTFQLIFNILVNGDGVITRRYTVDLFIDLMKDQHIQNALLIYDHFGLCLRQVLALLKTTDSESSSKILELVLAFCGVPNLRSCVCQIIMATPTVQNQGYNVENAAEEPFFMLVQWACQSVANHDQVSLRAVDVLREMNEEIIDTGSTVQLSLRLDVTLPMATELLTSQVAIDSPLMKQNCLKLLKVVDLMRTLCTDENSRQHVAQCLDLQVVFSILECQLNHNQIGLSMGRRSGHSDWSDAGVDVIFHTLSLMYQLRNDLPAIKQQIAQVLQNQLFVPFLAYTLTSSTRERIHISLQLLSISMSLAEFPLTLLGENITANNSLKSEEFEALRHPMESRQTVSPPRLNGKSSSSRLHRRPMQPSDSQVEILIEKMKTGMDLKDTRASEIMGIYEHKLATLETKESHLQDLLEAKALALSQADRLIAQYRCRRAQAEAEARKMRLLLQESENRIEEYRDERNESLLQKEQLQQEYREAAACLQEKEKRLKSVEDELHAEKDEHTNLRDVHGILQKHADDLQSQLEQAKLRIREQEDDYNSLEKERDDLESAIEKLRHELSRTEEAKKDFKQQVTALEAKRKRNEATIASKEETITKLTTELEKHDHITQMIHKLTGAGK